MHGPHDGVGRENEPGGVFSGAVRRASRMLNRSSTSSMLALAKSDGAMSVCFVPHKSVKWSLRAREKLTSQLDLQSPGQGPNEERKMRMQG